MSLAIRLHLFLVFGWTSTVGLLVFFVRPHVPRASFLAAAFFCLAWAVIWLISLVWRHRRLQHQRETRQFAANYNLFAMWGHNIGTVGVGFSILPFLDASWQPVAAFYVLGTIAVEFVATVRPPPARGRGSLAPLFLSASIIAYLAIEGGPLALALIVYHASFAWVMLVLRRILQRQSDRLYNALHQVEAERDARTRFLAAASHDLGQPLQAAQMFFDAAERHKAGPKHERAARSLHWAFETMGQQLEQILDHLKLEAGAATARSERFAIGPLMAELAEVNEAAALRSGTRIGVLPSSLAVVADPAMVRRALGNLIANALRHAKAKRVLIGARKAGGHVRLWVIDDGTGIPEADRARLFEDYQQGSNHGDEIRGGFGLGLASVRRLAEAMHGATGHDPRWTGGSAFWLDLPAA